MDFADGYELLGRPVATEATATLAGRLGFEIGRFVDELSLGWEAWRIGRVPDEALRRRAERYAKAVAFLEAEGFVEEPGRLFEDPAPMPPVERRPLRTFGLAPFESIRFASRPARIFPPEMETAARDLTNRNGFAYAYLWRHGDRGRRTILCIHGYRGGTAALDARAFDVPALFASGVDVALAILPYHGPRTPAGSTPGACFLNDARRTLEAAVQAVADLRALVGWLGSEGASAVGVAGFSLGGYLAALLASVESRLDYAAALVPVASFADIVWERSGRRGEHDAAHAAGLDLELLRRLFGPHCPLHHRPKVAAGRRLVIGGEGDRIAPPSHAAALARHWETQPRWFAGGHLAQLGRGPVLADLHALARGDHAPARGHAATPADSRRG